MRTFALATLLALALRPAAGAQTEPGPEAGPNWTGAIAEAFFSDPEMTTLRQEAELRANWDALPEAEQARVRRDCAAMAADASDVGGAASGGVSDLDPAGEGAAEGDEGAGTPLGAFPAGAASPAMAQACVLIEGR